MSPAPCETSDERADLRPSSSRQRSTNKARFVAVDSSLSVSSPLRGLDLGPLRDKDRDGGPSGIIPLRLSISGDSLLPTYLVILVSLVLARAGGGRLSRGYEAQSIPVVEL